MSISGNFGASAHDFDWLDSPTKENGKGWTPARKARIARALISGDLTCEQVQARYPDFSIEELEGWKTRFEQFGLPGMRSTRTQHYARLDAKP